MQTAKLVGRGVALLSVGALAVGLSACASGSGAPAKTTAAPSGPVNITYLHRLPDGPGMTPVKDIVAKWNKAHPDIQVTATKFDGAAAEMDTKLQTDIQAGSGPCLAQIGYADLPTMYVKGLLQNVTKEADKYKDNFSAGTIGMTTVNNQIVGLPQDTGPMVYFYDAAAFKKLGLAVPTTMDQLAQEAQTAAKSGKYIADFTPDEAQNWMTALSAAAGDTWFGSKDGKWTVNIDGAGAKQVASLWQGMLDKKDIFVGDRWGDSFTKALQDGQLIGHVGAAWEAGLLPASLKGSADDGQWKVALLPTFNGKQMTGPDGGSAVAVMKGCKYPAQAMEFNNWFNTQIEPLTTQGLVVAAKGTATTPPAMAKTFGGQDVLAVLGKANQQLNPDFPFMPGWSTLSSMAQDAAKASTGKLPVADIFSNAQNTAVSTLKTLGLPVAGQ